MIIENVSFPAGQHCETTTLGALLRHEGLDLSEPMLFGLGEGLGFVYWDAKSMDFPFLGGRTKPATITRTVADRLGLTLHIQETASPRKGWQNVATALTAGRPVGLQLDSYHLDYFTTKVHFGAHFAAMYGYDDTHAYLIDTAQQGGTVTTTLTSLERARLPQPTHRQPRPPRHRQGGPTGGAVARPLNQPVSRPPAGRGADGTRRDRRRPVSRHVPRLPRRMRDDRRRRQRPPRSPAVRRDRPVVDRGLPPHHNRRRNRRPAADRARSLGRPVTPPRSPHMSFLSRLHASLNPASRPPAHHESGSDLR